MIDTFIMLIVVILLTMVSQYTYVKTVLIVHFKYVQLTPQIYLKKALKPKRKHAADLWLPRGKRQGGGTVGSLRLEMQTIIYRVDKQQCPTLQYRELYLMSCDKP